MSEQIRIAKGVMRERYELCRKLAEARVPPVIVWYSNKARGTFIKAAEGTLFISDSVKCNIRLNGSTQSLTDEEWEELKSIGTMTDE